MSHPIHFSRAIRFALGPFRIFLVAAFLSFSPAWAQDATTDTAPETASAAAPKPETSLPTAAPVVSAGEESVIVDNPYGIQALWQGSDFVARGTLVILFIMSFGSWLILFTKFHEQQKLIRQGKRVGEKFWAAGAVEEALQSLPETSAYRFIAQVGVDATSKHQGLLGYIGLNDWIQLSIHRAIESIQSSLQKGLAFLATVGSTAPFIGLFGTVWGIYHALTAIGVAGQASIDKVAGPVGEALIMTAIGLAVAVPAVLGYNWLVRRNKALVEEIRSFGAELHAVLLGAQAERSAPRRPQVVQAIRAISV
ncbi:MAG: MotA/TolQ/ExbB proton channel family protein [Zoogloeaceae bacterium]|jgi:biopolymer transport protein ExbB|nr:MotA/TolQ/ExbB proton channel family protein [Zoogloeaceae bacterium]